MFVSSPHWMEHHWLVELQPPWPSECSCLEAERRSVALPAVCTYHQWWTPFANCPLGAHKCKIVVVDQSLFLPLILVQPTIQLVDSMNSIRYQNANPAGIDLQQRFPVIFRETWGSSTPVKGSVFVCLYKFFIIIGLTRRHTRK